MKNVLLVATQSNQFVVEGEILQTNCAGSVGLLDHLRSGSCRFRDAQTLTVNQKAPACAQQVKATKATDERGKNKDQQYQYDHPNVQRLQDQVNRQNNDLDKRRMAEKKSSDTIDDSGQAQDPSNKVNKGQALVPLENLPFNQIFVDCFILLSNLFRQRWIIISRSIIGVIQAGTYALTQNVGVGSVLDALLCCAVPHSFGQVQKEVVVAATVPVPHPSNHQVYNSVDYGHCNPESHKNDQFPLLGSQQHSVNDKEGDQYYRLECVPANFLVVSAFGSSDCVVKKRIHLVIAGAGTVKQEHGLSVAIFKVIIQDGINMRALILWKYYQLTVSLTTSSHGLYEAFQSYNVQFLFLYYTSEFSLYITIVTFSSLILATSDSLLLIAEVEGIDATTSEETKLILESDDSPFIFIFRFLIRFDCLNFVFSAIFLKFLKLTGPTLLLQIYRLRPFWSPCFFLVTTLQSSVLRSTEDRDGIFGSLFDLRFGNLQSCYLIYLCFFINEMLFACIGIIVLSAAKYIYQYSSRQQIDES